jgi:hypothetical protein
MSFLEINSEPQTPAAPHPPPYATLDCSENDKKFIAKLTGMLAEHNQLWFFFHRNELKEKIKPLKDKVHFLKILEAIFTNSRLKSDIKKIHKTASKWKAVVHETKKKMNKLEKAGHLYTYTNDFAIAVGLPPAETQGYFQRKDWNGLLAHLIKKM